MHLIAYRVPGALSSGYTMSNRRFVGAEQGESQREEADLNVTSTVPATTTTPRTTVATTTTTPPPAATPSPSSSRTTTSSKGERRNGPLAHRS